MSFLCSPSSPPLLLLLGFFHPAPSSSSSLFFTPKLSLSDSLRLPLLLLLFLLLSFPPPSSSSFLFFPPKLSLSLTFLFFAFFFLSFLVWVPFAFTTNTWIFSNIMNIFQYCYQYLFCLVLSALHVFNQYLNLFKYNEYFSILLAVPFLVSTFLV